MCLSCGRTEQKKQKKRTYFMPYFAERFRVIFSHPTGAKRAKTYNQSPEGLANFKDVRKGKL
jgi:hypothetical protein